MSNPEESNPPFRFTIKAVACVVLIVSVCCAIIPGTALVVVGATPVAAGFMVFVFGDQRNRDWIMILGATLMAVGLALGGWLMLMVQGMG